MRGYESAETAISLLRSTTPAILRSVYFSAQVRSSRARAPTQRSLHLKAGAIQSVVGVDLHIRHGAHIGNRTNADAPAMLRNTVERRSKKGDKITTCQRCGYYAFCLLYWIDDFFFYSDCAPGDIHRLCRRVTLYGVTSPKTVDGSIQSRQSRVVRRLASLKHRSSM